MPSNKRHQPCGADNRKKKNKKDEEAKSQKNGLLRYFKKSETLDTFVENNDEQDQHAMSREDKVDENISEDHGEEPSPEPENMNVVNEEELKEKR